MKPSKLLCILRMRTAAGPLRASAAFAAAVLLVAGICPARAEQLPGMGLLAGKVSSAKSAGLLTIYAFNTDKHVGYMVYVVKGKYRATNVFPGHYDVTLRGTVGQRNWTLPQQTVQLEIVAGKQSAANFTVADGKTAPSYVGGMPYPNAMVAPYDVVYPPGRGREVIERVCFGCHTLSFYPYNVVRTYPGGRTQHDRDGWALTVDRMSRGVAFFTQGKPSYFDAALLPAEDREAVIEYLASNFGPDSVPRAVEQESDPQLDEAVLEKAEFVEYRFLNKAGESDRFVHTPDFDGEGNVWIMDRGAASLVKVDPRTGEVTDHQGHGGGESMTVDTDGTVWYGGLSHYDPKSNLHDEYKFDGGGKNGRSIPVSTLVIDSNGDIWLSLLPTGGLAKFDRKANTVVWWDVPDLRSRPYGLTLDHNDKVWFAEYHNSGIASFDPKTHAFRHYALTIGTPTNIRRLAADSKDFIWSVTWGSRALMNAALYRVNPMTGEVAEHKLNLPYANPYDAEVDAADNVWIATDNHILEFDQKTEKFTRYPVPERTDIPKIAATRDGAIWFGPRNAGQSGGYGGAASVLYPDKDKIKTFAAYYDTGNARFRKTSYVGPPTPVSGVTKLVPAAPQNPGEYASALGIAAACPDPGTKPTSSPLTLQGGAAKE